MAPVLAATRDLKEQADEIGQALGALFSSVGLYRRGKGASSVIVGIEWNGREPLRIEGP